MVALHVRLAWNVQDLQECSCPHVADRAPELVLQQDLTPAQMCLAAAILCSGWWPTGVQFQTQLLFCSKQEGDHIGLTRKSNSALHFFINGIDQGEEVLPWALWPELSMREEAWGRGPHS